LTPDRLQMQPNYTQDAVISEPGAAQLHFLREVDGRTKLAKRFKEICRAIARDQGGDERLSEARIQFIRRFAAAAVLAEQMESKLASGEEIDVHTHALLCSSLVRLAQRIGLNRVPKKITPTLSDYLADANQNQSSDEDAA
jgi:hypothetical protein